MYLFRCISISCMRNVLIPTQLKSPTINAIKAAIKYGSSGCTITLLILQDGTNSFMVREAQRNITYIITKSQRDILATCRQLVDDTENCTLKVHIQYGISGPLVKNIMNSFNTQLIILPAGFPPEKNRPHIKCLQLLLNSKYPILHLSRHCNNQDFNKAFYIEYNKSPIEKEVIINVIKNILPVKTILSEKIYNDSKCNNIPLQLAEAILNNNTDLIIETRKPARVNLNRNIQSPADRLGITVLSIAESTIQNTN